MPAVSTEEVPRTVRIAAVLTALQAAAGLVFALVLLVRTIVLGSGGLPSTDIYGEVGYYLVLSGAILAVGIGLWRGKRWARTPTLLLQLLLLGVAWYFFGTTRQPVAGAVVGVPALAVLWFLFNRAGRSWAFPAKAVPESERK
jgi:hypothetical protein